jgi:AcrR family transcriptional regulator
MTKHTVTPQSLIDSILRLTGRTSPTQQAADPTTRDRILDAALAGFTERGISATTMSRIASDTGISREWLYKHFKNRDAVVLAVSNREALRLIDGLATQAFESDDLAGAVTDVFVYSVEFLRDNALLQRVLHSEPEVLSPQLLQRSTSIVGLAVRAGAGYLTALGDFDHDQAIRVAETLVRLAAAITFAPHGELDLHDPAELRRYAAIIIPPMIAATKNAAAKSSKTTKSKSLPHQ